MIVLGTNTADTLGSGGDDTVIGLAGDDSLTGYLPLGTALGNTTYRFSKGDGNDIISENAGSDTIEFTDVKSTEVFFKLGNNGKDLVILYGINDSITISEMIYWPSGRAIESFKFSDGVVWDLNALYNNMATSTGTLSNDYISGWGGLNVIDGKEGDDSIYGQAKNDTLLGGAGNDSLYGGAGNDVSDGGSGNDYLYDWSGNNTLLGGAGNDSLYGGAGNDVLNGGDGSDILFGGDGNDIYYINDINDQIYDSNGVADTAYISVNGVRTTGIENAVYTNDAQPLPYFINALDSGRTWGLLGQGQTLSYSFALNADGGEVGFELYTEEQKTAIREALQKYAQLINLTFVEVSDSTSVQLRFFRDDLSSAGYGAPVYAGYGSYPSNGDVHIRNTISNLNQLDGNFDVLMHEIGHALGLKHPFQGADILPTSEDSTTYSAMSYNSFGQANKNTVRMYDLATLHYFYGVNASQRSENNTYTFSDVGFTAHYVWDGAGVDVFDANSQTQNVSVNLNPGSWNFIGSKAEGILSAGQSFIGFGTLIENAMSGTGNDTVIGNALDNQIHSNAGNDWLKGGAGNDSLYAEDGNDTLNGQFGTDVMVGGAGDDYYYFDDVGDVVIEALDAGLDCVEASANCTLNNHVENLLLSGSVALSGTGNALNNQLIGNAAGNLLKGMAGNDSMLGFAGNDTLDGGTGNDTLRGGLGNDVLNGGDGVDWADYVDMTASVNVNLNVTTVQVTGAGGSDTLTNIENVRAGSANDNLKGNASDNTLDGQAGNDALFGNAGHDNLIGGAGNDILNGGLGNDTLSGGDGNDWADYFDSTAAVNVDLRIATQQNTVGAGLDIFYNIENLRGGLGNDTLNGSVYANALAGQAGNDFMVGNGGNDTLYAGLGNDTLFGGTGNDTYQFNRGDGQDTLTDADATVGNSDILAFQTGVTNNQLWLTHVGNDLVVSVIGTTDKVTIKNWYVSSNNHVESITAGGKTLLDGNVNALVSAMSAFTPPAAGQTTLPTSYQTALNPVIAANWG